MTTSPPPDPSQDGHKSIHSTIEYISNDLVKLTIAQFSPSDSVIRTMLEQAVRLTVKATTGGSLDLSESAQATLRDVTSACNQKRHEPSGWDNGAWQEAQIFAHLCSAAVMYTAADETHPEGINSSPPPGSSCPKCDCCEYGSCIMMAMRSVDLAFMIGAPKLLYEPFVAAIAPKAQAISQTLGTHQSSIQLPFLSCLVGIDEGSSPAAEECKCLYPIPETVAHELDAATFKKKFWKQDQPVVLLGLSRKWPAAAKWPDLAWWVEQHGHRTVPLELGLFSQGTFSERAQTFSDFVLSYMSPSVAHDRISMLSKAPACHGFTPCDKVASDSTAASPRMSGCSGTSPDEWGRLPGHFVAIPNVPNQNADDWDGSQDVQHAHSAPALSIGITDDIFGVMSAATHGNGGVPDTSLAKGGSATYIGEATTCAHRKRRRDGQPAFQVAYLAQHRLLDHLPSLWDDVSVPSFWLDEYEQANVWIGTCGTVTALHFDSYDNFLCQVAGEKYVRLYDRRETRKLYVDRSTSSGAFAQGNTSLVDVENPDLAQFPLFADATYTEIVLKPGDGLFIPAKCWHYVRSLSTSISINFWF